MYITLEASYYESNLWFDYLAKSTNVSPWFYVIYTDSKVWLAGIFHSKGIFSGWYWTARIGYFLDSADAINNWPFSSVLYPVILKNEFKDGYLV